MKPLRLSVNALATALHVPASWITGLVHERRNIDAEMALRLQQYFGMSAQFWMNVQMKYELEFAQDTLASRIRREVRPAPRDRETGELKLHTKVTAKNAGPSTRSRQSIGATSLRMTN